MDEKRTIIGKDVIESLTLGMYEDSRFIYREYIQNAADQIDKAVQMGLLKSRNEGYVEIEIDKEGKQISFLDNATGIETTKVLPILKNIAQSTKDREKQKGFRGIGRLGGLGYCDRLVFETTYEGENVKSVLTWDAKLLKNIIHDRSKKEEAVHVIDKVIRYSTEAAQTEQRYFKVTLKGVTNDALLDKADIIEYLSMIAPVPYNKGFIFSDQIHDEVKKIGQGIDEYVIYVNTDKIFKAYTTSIYKSDNGGKSKIDDVNQLQCFKIEKTDGELLAWGWYGISNFEGVIPKVNLARGLRLRKGNIQIGSDSTLVKLFKETRGNFYFFGEIHVFHKDLIPNARRDYFLENNTMLYFEKMLKNLCQEELYTLYYFASKVRNTKKKIDTLVSFKEKFEEKQNKGWTNNKEEQEYKEKFDDLKEKAEKAETGLQKMKENLGENDNSKRKLFNRVTGETEENIGQITLSKNSSEDKKYLTDDLSKLSRKEKKLISIVFGVIDRVLPKELAENLKEKIKEEFK